MNIYVLLIITILSIMTANPQFISSYYLIHAKDQHDLLEKANQLQNEDNQRIIKKGQ